MCFQDFLTFFHHLLIDILHVSNNVLDFCHKLLYFVQFRFHGVLVLNQFHLYVYQILHQDILCSLLNIQYAILDNLVPMDYPISLNDLLVLLSIRQNHMDFFFLDLYQLLLLLFGHLSLFLIKYHICLILKHQNI